MQLDHEFPIREKDRVRRLAGRDLPARVAGLLARLLAREVASAVASARPHGGRFGHRSTRARAVALARDVLSSPP